MKQNLKVKTFVGTTENALRIQIWTALLALLLLKWLHFLSAAGWSLSNLASLLRLNLFTYRDLREWLDHPLETPPLLPLQNNSTWPSLVLESFRHDTPDLNPENAPIRAHQTRFSGHFRRQLAAFLNSSELEHATTVAVVAHYAAGHRRQLRH